MYWLGFALVLLVRCALGNFVRGGEDSVCDDRRVLVQVSLRQEEQVLLRRLAKAAGLEPAVLAHEVLMEGLRRLQTAYGGGHALPTPVRVGARAYPLRRVVDLRHEPIAIGQEYMLDRATEVLECGHTACTFVVIYPAQTFDGQRRRCAHCASPAQRARAGHPARRRW